MLKISISHPIDKFLASFRYHLSALSRFRSDLVFRFLNGLFPLITMLIWSSIYPDKREILIPYFLIVFFMGQLITSPTVSTLDRDIRYGSLSYRLLLPYSIFLYYLSNKFSYSYLSLIYTSPILLLVMLLLIKTGLNIVDILCFFISSIFAILIFFMRQFLTGLLGFWTEKSVSLDRLLASLQHLASGAFVPLFLFPDIVQRLLFFTPFPYTIYAPCFMLMPNGGLYHKIVLLFGQIMWSIILYILIYFTMKSGLKKYGAIE